MRRFLHIVLIFSLLIVSGCGFTSPPVLDNISDKQLVVDSPVDKEIIEKKDEGEKTEVTEGETDSSLEEKPAIDTIEGEEKGPVSHTESIRLRVSQNFGRDIIFNQAISFQDDDLLEIMQDNLELDTSYGGSFVSGINGIKMKSGPNRSDWFLYINGIASHTGLKDYEPSDKDKVYWDYHRWNPSSTNNAIIGAYPAPFLNGYRGKNNPTIILHDESNGNLADKLASSLRNLGVKVETNTVNTDIINQPTIVIGTWGNLSKNKTLEDLNKGYQRNGLGVHFTVGGLDLLNDKGQVARTITDSSAVIVAWGRSLGDANPLWLIVGNDDMALKKAINTLINDSGNIQGLYGVALTPQGQLPLPLR